MQNERPYPDEGQDFGPTFEIVDYGNELLVSERRGGCWHWFNVEGLRRLGQDACRAEGVRRMNQFFADRQQMQQSPPAG